MAAATALLGLVFIIGFIAMCSHVFLHIWIHPHPSEIAIELLLTGTGVAVGIYIILLGYRLAFRPSRRTFERVCSLAFVLIFVSFQHGKPLSSVYLLFWFCVAIGGFILLRLASNRLFSD
jgi:hypothetical protein